MVVTVIAYAIEDPLYSAGSVDRPHTHAFDVYACPFRSPTSNLPSKLWEQLTRDLPLFEVVALSGVGVLLIAGLGIAWFDPSGRLEAALAKPPEPVEQAAGSWLNADVPGSVLGGVAIAGLVALSLVGCFVYYPTPAETLEDMKMVRADALSDASSHDVEKTIKSIARYDDLTAR